MVDAMSTSAVKSPQQHERATVIFDFDGTVALGSGPLLAFARSIGDRTNADVLADARKALWSFETGHSDHRDGYGAIATAAKAHGIDPAEIDGAYHASRSGLGTDAAPLNIPDGFGDFLGRLTQLADVWLATNAPPTGIDSFFSGVGISHYFSRKCFKVGKPDGLHSLLAEASARGPVLSVGDIYDYDLAPAVAIGAATALVGATTARERRAVTMRAASLDALYPEIEAWAAAAVPSSPLRPSQDNPTS